MKRLFAIFLFGVIFLVQPSYSQHPQLKMWSIPYDYYKFQTKGFDSLPEYTGYNYDGYTGTVAECFHNIMYMNNNMTSLDGHPFDSINKLWFYVVDNNIYYKDGTLVCSLNNGGNTCELNNTIGLAGMLTGEVCVVPVPDKAIHPNEYYVITPRDYTRLHLCESSDCEEGVVKYDVDQSHSYYMYNLQTIKNVGTENNNIERNCNVRYFFLATSKEFMLNGVPTRYLFRYVSAWHVGVGGLYETTLDVFKITGKDSNDGIQYVTSFNEYPYFYVGKDASIITHNKMPPFEFPYISEMELVSKTLGNDNGNDNITFRLALPYTAPQISSVDTTINANESIPGIKVFEFDRNLTVLDNKDYNFRRLNVNDNIDNLDGHKINGLEFSPDGKYLFFNFSGAGTGYANNKRLVYIYLNDYGNLTPDTGNYFPNRNPNTIPLIYMPVPISNYHTDYARSFIEWGYDSKLYYVNNHSFLTVNFQNKSDYNPASLLTSDWDTIHLPCQYNISWDIGFIGASESCNCYDECNAVYTLPDQIDGEVYDADLGCCMTAPACHDTTICASANIDVSQYISSWSFDSVKYDFGDGTSMITDNTLGPIHYIYNQMGNYKLKITLYYSCGTISDSSNIHVICCNKIFTFNDTTICIGSGRDYSPGFHWYNPYDIYPLPSSSVVDFGDGPASIITTQYNGNNFFIPTYHYTTPGYRDITIILYWGTGNCTSTYSAHVTVNTGGAFPDLTFPDSTICSGSCPCSPKWEGPFVDFYNNSLGFNAYHYDLTIWDDNGVYYPTKHGDTTNYCSFNNGDIYFNFPTYVQCKHYNFQLFLMNCSMANIYTGGFYVKGCDCQGGLCVDHCCNNDFDFNDTSICLEQGLVPNYHFTNIVNPDIHPVSINYDFGDYYNYGGDNFTSSWDATLLPYHYSHTGTYALTITMDWGCGTPTSRTHIVTVLCCSNDFNFNDTMICVGQGLEPNYYYYINYPGINPSTINYDFGDNYNIGADNFTEPWNAAPFPYHYSYPGTYVLTISMDWGCGSPNSRSHYVTVICCSKNFIFNSATICLDSFYNPDFRWANSDTLNMVFPFTLTTNYGDGTIDSFNETSFPISRPQPHQYTLPGIYKVAITARWGYGCLVTDTQIVTVRLGGNISLPVFNDTTTCVGPPCHSLWSSTGISFPLNAEYYNLTITNKNYAFYHYKEGSALTPTSLMNTDIFDTFPDTILCRHYHYSLLLENCNNTVHDTGSIYITGCWPSEDHLRCLSDICNHPYNDIGMPDGIKNINNLDNTIKLYPNPTRDRLNINVQDVFGNPIEYDIEVQDILSKSLQCFKCIKTNLYTLDLSPYCKGIYMIKIITNNKSYIYKEVKE